MKQNLEPYPKFMFSLSDKSIYALYAPPKCKCHHLQYHVIHIKLTLTLSSTLLLNDLACAEIVAGFLDGGRGLKEGGGSYNPRSS